MLSNRRRPDERPLIRVSVKLVDTYVGINKRYYETLSGKDPVQCAPRESTNSGFDDADYNYIIQIGELWDSRYRVCRILGQGSFGKVVEAFDLVDRRSYAIKIIKNRKAFYQQALLEIEILGYLNKTDGADTKNIVRLKRFFEFKSHLCLVYELLSFNLYELLRSKNFKGVSLGLVRKFAQQLLVGMDHLLANDKKVIHCDLKPENILLRRPKSSKIKVADFGSSCFSNQKIFTYIQSRFYRSPEIILGQQYGPEIDMWSLGCLLVEMLTGVPLFNGSNEHHQLCKFWELLGEPPKDFLQNSSLAKLQRFAVQNGSQYSLTVPAEFRRRPQKSLREIIMAKATEADAYEHEVFCDFISRIICYIPTTRLSPSEALHHPFLMTSIGTNTPFSLNK